MHTVLIIPNNVWHGITTKPTKWPTSTVQYSTVDLHEHCTVYYIIALLQYFYV